MDTLRSIYQVLLMVSTISFFNSNVTVAQVIHKWQLQKTNALLATKFELSKKGQVYYLKMAYDDNSSANDAVILKKKGNRTIIEYKKKDDYNGEYHVIEPDGQLGLYNKEGKRFGLAALKK